MYNNLPKKRPFLVDPAIVAAFLDKPYNLREAWNTVAAARGTPVAEGSLTYTPSERAHLTREAQRLYNEQLARLGPPRPDLQRRFTLSAGAPGAGKSTLLEHLIREEEAIGQHIFSDPDERALKLMPVYHSDIAAFGGGQTGLALSYTKWRWGSNFISHTIMNRACAEKRAILLGTTATSPFMETLYGNAHQAGYESETLIVCAPESVRYESVRRRFEIEGTRFTDAIKEKGMAFYERLPVLLRQTSHFRLYWRDRIDGGAVLAATGHGGAIRIHDAAALYAIHRDVRRNNPALSWRDLAGAYQKKGP